MHLRTRYAILAACALVRPPSLPSRRAQRLRNRCPQLVLYTFHRILSASSASYTALGRLWPSLDTVDVTRANATFLFLARNAELPGVLRSMQSLEARFNRRHGYPYTFLNELDFSDEFKAFVKSCTNARAVLIRARKQCHGGDKCERRVRADTGR
jgi:hypothetical protein